MLGVGRHQARRRLLQSGLPYRLISRHWRHPLDQSWYTRKCYAIPAKIVLALDSQQEERELLIMKRQLIRRGYKFSRLAYLTGWRVRSEVLPLTWRQVDFDRGIVRLEPGSTKNDEGRVFPFSALPALTDLLRCQWDRRMELQMQRGSVVPWVFHRNGQRLRDFRRAWENACKLAGGPPCETWNEQVFPGRSP